MKTKCELSIDGKQNKDAHTMGLVDGSGVGAGKDPKMLLFSLKER